MKYRIPGMLLFKIHSICHYLYFNKITSHPLLLFAFLLLGIGCKNPLDTKVQTTPLQQLVMGNQRFALLAPTHPDENLERLQKVSQEQHPKAVIICCSDSRVPPELIFDEGFGDLFVIRTAGNIIAGMEMGSIEYAVDHLGVKLIVLMGHENCGAVKAFIEGGHPPGHIKDIVDSLQQEPEIKAIPVNDINRLDDCVRANVSHGIKQMKTQSVLIHEKLEKGELQIVGARYDLDDFRVSIIQ